MESSSMDWELLPKHILDLIHYKLVYLVDYIYFGAVCKEWRSVAQDNRKRRRTINASHPHQLPLLLVPIKDKDERLIYSIAQDRVSNMRLRVPFNKRYYGSSYGWLIDMDETFSIILLNPFLEKVIKLPPITKGDESTTDHELFILKAILSNDPDLYPNDFMVAIIYNGMRYLSVYKSSARSWTYLPDHPNGMGYRGIIHHKGDFYAIDVRLGVGKIDVAGIEKCPRPQVSLVAHRAPSALTPEISRVYLVGTYEGNLLLVQRVYTLVYPDPVYGEWDDVPIFTSSFIIHKLEESKELVEIRGIGDNAMFLGDYISFLLPICGIPGLQRNCIYYTNNKYDPYIPYDAGIFNVTDGSIKPHHIAEDTKELPPMVWITPALSGDLA
ncbi:hypothetical protein SLE2022_289290 [Rubroshorea leprosula]